MRREIHLWPLRYDPLISRELGGIWLCILWHCWEFILIILIVLCTLSRFNKWVMLLLRIFNFAILASSFPLRWSWKPWRLFSASNFLWLLLQNIVLFLTLCKGWPRILRLAAGEDRWAYLNWTATCTLQHWNVWKSIILEKLRAVRWHRRGMMQRFCCHATFAFHINLLQSSSFNVIPRSLFRDLPE